MEDKNKIPVTELSGLGAATELCRRLQAGTRAITGDVLAGWPPYAHTIAIVSGFLAEYGLHIEDAVDDEPH